MVQTFEDVRSVANALGWGCQFSPNQNHNFCVDFYRQSPAGIDIYFAYDVESPADISSELRSEADFEFDVTEYMDSVLEREKNQLTKLEAISDAASVLALLRELADYLESWRGD